MFRLAWSALMGGGPPAAPPTAPPLTLDELIADARRFEEAGISEQARKKYRHILAIAPRNSEPTLFAIMGLSRLAIAEANWEEANSGAAQAYTLATALKDPDLTAQAINVSVSIKMQTGELVRADTMAQDALVMAKNPKIRGILHTQRATIAAQQKNYCAAHTLYGKALEAFYESDYRFGLALTYVNQGTLAYEQGDYEYALSRAIDGQKLALDLGALDVVAVAVTNAAEALIHLHRTDDAENLLVASLGHFLSTRHPLRQGEVYEILGELFETRGPSYYAAARKSFETALALAVAANSPLHVTRIAERIKKIASCSPEAPALDFALGEGRATPAFTQTS